MRARSRSRPPWWYAISPLNAVLAQRAVRAAVPAAVRQPRDCECGSALAAAIVTAPEAVAPSARERLGLLVDRYLTPPPPS